MKFKELESEINKYIGDNNLSNSELYDFKKYQQNSVEGALKNIIKEIIKEHLGEDFLAKNKLVFKDSEQQEIKLVGKRQCIYFVYKTTRNTKHRLAYNITTYGLKSVEIQPFCKSETIEDWLKEDEDYDKKYIEDKNKRYIELEEKIEASGLKIQEIVDIVREYKQLDFDKKSELNKLYNDDKGVYTY